MCNRMYYLRRAVVAVILLGVVLYHSAGLMRLLERALSAPPRQQAAGIISLTVTVLLCRILWNGLATVVVGDRGASTAHTVVPMGVARLAHPGAVARSDQLDGIIPRLTLKPPRPQSQLPRSLADQV